MAEVCHAGGNLSEGLRAAAEEEPSSAEKNDWVSLFDGKSLAGWEKVGKTDSHWEVREGALA